MGEGLEKYNQWKKKKLYLIWIPLIIVLILFFIVGSINCKNCLTKNIIGFITVFTFIFLILGTILYWTKKFKIKHDLGDYFKLEKEKREKEKVKLEKEDRKKEEERLKIGITEKKIEKILTKLLNY